MERHAPDHHSKCKYLHGHRYTVTAYLKSECLVDGMVLDFGFLKAAMMKAIHDPYDHKLILYEDDVIALDRERARGNSLDEGETILFASIKTISMIPTAENLAEHWFKELVHELTVMVGEGTAPAEIRLVEMEVQETPTSIAVYTP